MTDVILFHHAQGLTEGTIIERGEAADSSLPSYDAAAAALLKQRVLDFLGRVS
jgi:hypothetical protein